MRQRRWGRDIYRTFFSRDKREEINRVETWHNPNYQQD
ncbi:MAG: hypothetical protein ANABAC_2793 [Anaerolineae bacterium]|nr:MAG: hypothetical protein ANABAC_2793 [Anaerolineae bacterium]